MLAAGQQCCKLSGLHDGRSSPLCISGREGTVEAAGLPVARMGALSGLPWRHAGRVEYCLSGSHTSGEVLFRCALDV